MKRDWSFLFDGKLHSLVIGKDIASVQSFRQLVTTSLSWDFVPDGMKFRTKIVGQKLLCQLVPRRPTRTCPKCGKVFTPKYNSKHCGRECAGKSPGANAILAVELWNTTQMNQSEIAAELKITRARVGQLLWKYHDQLNTPIRARMGHRGRPKQHYPCKICGANTGKRVIIYCSPECRVAALLNRNGKWSRYSFVDLTCANCRKDFRRTNYQHAISMAFGAKTTYCSRDCFLASGALSGKRRA